ncbi:hypothetical protein [Ruegeria hyattellae]|uniref:hypothetical protein n=1 Tax=Ruegeria hyattellae TaxID=3233337 RepID=UPI00355B9689
MRMHRDMIRKYTRKLTQGAGASAPDPMSDLSRFDLDILGVQRAAEADGNTDWLRLSLDALITDPTGRINIFAGQGYPFSDAQLVELFTYAFHKIWPDAMLSEPGNELVMEFERMTDEEWADQIDSSM